MYQLAGELQEPVMTATDASALKRRALLGGVALGALGASLAVYLLMRKDKRYTANRSKKTAKAWFVFMYERGDPSPKQYFGPLATKRGATRTMSLEKKPLSRHQ